MQRYFSSDNLLLRVIEGQGPWNQGKCGTSIATACGACRSVHMCTPSYVRNQRITARIFVGKWRLRYRSFGPVGSSGRRHFNSTHGFSIFFHGSAGHCCSRTFICRLSIIKSRILRKAAYMASRILTKYTLPVQYLRHMKGEKISCVE